MYKAVIYKGIESGRWILLIVPYCEPCLCYHRSEWILMSFHDDYGDALVTMHELQRVANMIIP